MLIMKKILFYSLSLALLLSIVACNSDSQSNIKTKETEKAKPIDEFAELEGKLAADSTNIELRNLLATRYYSTGQLEKAAYHFIEIYKQDNSDLNAITNLGNIYYDDHQDAKAIEFYEKAIKVDSTNINIRCDLATCYSNLSNYKMAIKILKHNSEIDPRHAKSHYNLSIMYNRIGDKVNAEKELKTYQTLTEGAK
jgi:tetratricopeptide (TPR) repeat protein